MLSRNDVTKKSRVTALFNLLKKIFFNFTGQLIGEFLQGIVGFYLGKLKNEWSQILFWSGNCCSLWTLAWFSFGANHPKECFYMDRNERKFLQNRQRYKAKYGVVNKFFFIF